MLMKIQTQKCMDNYKILSQSKYTIISELKSVAVVLHQKCSQSHLIFAFKLFSFAIRVLLFVQLLVKSHKCQICLEKPALYYILPLCISKCIYAV